jgi:hypothetical protein
MSPVSFEDVKRFVTAALGDFEKYDHQLLELCVDERAATHRLACHLQKHFSGWNADCEYNRKGRNPKELDGVLVRPDIIIHKRDSNDDNLLCIEAKKSGESIKKINADRKKLQGFTRSAGEYKYRFGLLIILSLTAPYKIDCEWFEDGKSIEIC